LASLARRVLINGPLLTESVFTLTRTVKQSDRKCLAIDL
jgi:hypothetical protein